VPVLECLALAKVELLVGFLTGSCSGDLLVAALKRISLITLFLPQCLQSFNYIPLNHFATTTSNRFSGRHELLKTLRQSQSSVRSTSAAFYQNMAHVLLA
jgi:hypothetical protein